MCRHTCSLLRLGREVCSPKCQQCFLPAAAAGYRWGGESQLLAPRIKSGLQRNNGSALLSGCPSCCHIGNFSITQPKRSTKGLRGCLDPFCLKWKVMNAALLDRNAQQPCAFSTSHPLLQNALAGLPAFAGTQKQATSPSQRHSAVIFAQQLPAAASAKTHALQTSKVVLEGVDLVMVRAKTSRLG